jgi:tetratricopeptide (TPR) repeat protein
MGYMQLGNLLQLQGAHEKAVELREWALQLAPSDFGAVCGLGAVLLAAGYTDRAFAMLKRAALVAPRYPPSLCSLTAFAHLVAGDNEAALQMLQRAKARRFEHIGVRLVGAMALTALGRSTEAADEIKAARQENPRYTVSDWIAAHDDFKDRAVISRLGRLLAQAGLPA